MMKNDVPGGTTPVEEPQVKIHPSLIPPLELKLFCLALAEAAIGFYEDPANEAAFQAWLAERR